MMNCSLCNYETKFFTEIRNKKYYQCHRCLSIMMDPNDYLDASEEKERYKQHNNDVEDPRYQKFVSPIVTAVLNNYDTSHQGLDYGAGTGPVITKVLNDHNYRINLYDPYFHPFNEHLKITYDFIVCCEVVEHFYNPYNEFKLFSKLLNTGGSLFIMTKLYHEDIDFDTWSYANDQTHVFFYHQKALEWIKKEFNYKGYHVDDRLIVFKR